MSHANPTNNLSWVRIKLALIPVLGLVLAAVVFRSSKHETARDAVAHSGTRLDASLPPAERPDSKKHSWPKAQLDDVIAFNPFEPPALPPSPSSKVAAEAPISLSQTRSEVPAPKLDKIGKLQAVYQDDRGAVAIVDSRIVRVGDLVDGCRVVEISPQGIVVEREH